MIQLDIVLGIEGIVLVIILYIYMMAFLVIVLASNVQNNIRQMSLLNMYWRIWYPVVNGEIIGFKHPLFRFDDY